MWMCAHVSAVACRGQMGPQEVEIQAVVKFLMRVLGTKLGASTRAVCTFNYRAISPSLQDPSSAFKAEQAKRVKFVL